MRIINGVVPGVSRLAGLQVELSKKARQRLKWFDYYHSRGYNASNYADGTNLERGIVYGGRLVTPLKFLEQ